MSTITELLEALNTREAAVSTADLAGQLKASKESTLKQLTREKDKGTVSGSSQEGWDITSKGRQELEAGEIHPTMTDEEVTPRQQFEAIARRIGIKEDRIFLATDQVWSGDYKDINWVWTALGQMDIADDLRSVWVNSWRAKLHKSIPPELENELAGASKPSGEEERDDAPSKPGGRDFIIVEDEPVRIGANLGDYSLQDAKDILALRALKGRLIGTGQSGNASPVGAAAGITEVLSALAPYINKGTDMDALKEILADKLELQKVDILNRIPTQGQPAPPKTFGQQLTEMASILGTLKEFGPTLRAILGVPESPGNPSPGAAVQIKGPDGQPIVMDLGQVIDWRRFLGEEKRADERHGALIGIAKTIRENASDGVAALKAAAEEAKAGGEDKTSEATQKPPVFSCGECHTQFGAPPGWAGQPIKCPNPQCGREYSKKELEA